MARLIMLQGGEATPFGLDGDEIVLGRLPECDIQLQSNMVSRRHARLIRRGGQFLLEDLGSGNGSFVNGKRIESPTPLKHDDRVKLGPVLLRFSVSDADDGTGSTLTDEPFSLSLTDDDPSSTITGSVSNTSGFGLLDIQPEAKLRAVLDISRSLVGTHDVDAMLPKVLDTLFEVFPHADRGCILLKEERSGRMIPRAIKHRLEGTDDSVKISRTILEQVLEKKQAILSADATSDERFQASESISALTIHSMMCAPLLNRAEEPIGVINIDTQNPLAQFKSEDVDILIAVAGQAALSYENARLLASHIEKQKQDAEMAIARNVQRALLPDHLPDIDGYEFFASYEAAQAVGGDYYDVTELPDGRVGIAFGDVAGKGVPASLVMSQLSSAVRSVVEFVSDPAQAVTRINNHLCANAVEGRFVTFVLAILDTRRHTLSIVNAGHMSPLVRHADGSTVDFNEETVGVPLGVIDDFEFEAVTGTLEPGDSVVVYTDGVSEAMNPEGDLYGVPRLREFVASYSGRPSELGSAILEDVKRHAAGRPQNDDITLMVFGRVGD